MKTKEVIMIGIFIVAVCAISVIPFSNNMFNSSNALNATIHLNKESFDGNGNVASKTTPISTTAPTKTPMPTVVKTNVDFLNAVISALSQDPDKAKDKVSIYNIQGLISTLKTQNAATLLGEIGNPNNLTDPRLFLQYMNWFGSNCSLDSNTCDGLN